MKSFNWDCFCFFFFMLLGKRQRQAQRGGMDHLLSVQMKPCQRGIWWHVHVAFLARSTPGLLHTGPPRAIFLVENRLRGAVCIWHWQPGGTHAGVYLHCPCSSTPQRPAQPVSWKGRSLRWHHPGTVAPRPAFKTAAPPRDSWGLVKWSWIQVPPLCPLCDTALGLASVSSSRKPDSSIYSWYAQNILLAPVLKHKYIL